MRCTHRHNDDEDVCHPRAGGGEALHRPPTCRGVAHAELPPPLNVAEEEAVAVVQDRPPVLVVVEQEAEHAVYFGDRRRRRAGTAGRAK